MFLCLSKTIILKPLCRMKGACVGTGEIVCNVVRRHVAIGATDLIHHVTHLFKLVVVIGFDNQAAGVAIFNHACFISDAQIIVPVTPIVPTLIGQRTGLVGRIISADDGAGARS